MQRIWAISALSLMIAAGIFALVAYVNHLGQQDPAIEQEKKGRAQYLIDTRAPRFTIEWKEMFGFLKRSP